MNTDLLSAGVSTIGAVDMPRTSRSSARDLLEERERDEAKLAALRAAIEEGEASGVAEGDPVARVRSRLGLPQRP
jgi:hypothetical protein